MSSLNEASSSLDIRADLVESSQTITGELLLKNRTCVALIKDASELTEAQYVTVGDICK
jgi:hypothetical protein